MRPIVVAGAGSIGCFIGGLLALGGRDVRFLGRAGLADEVRAAGLHLTCHTGLDERLAADAVRFGTEASVLGDAGIVIVTVKSVDTAAMAALIRDHAPGDAVIVSLQNGVGNPDLLRRVLPDRRVVGGMVPFNVLRMQGARFHRGTSGAVVIEAGADGLREVFSVPGLDVREDRDFVGVQWGKLLLNLNNALNALSDLPLRQELRLRAWRRILADQIEEALAVLKASDIAPRSNSILPARLLPTMLRAPDWLFPILARSAVRIDPRARSSMWEDLQRGRATEIGELQGAVIALADRVGIAVPANRLVATLIARREAGDDASLSANSIRGLYRWSRD